MTALETDGLLYRTRPYLQKRFERIGKQLAFKATTLAQWKAWRRKLVARLAEITGYDTMLRTPPRVKITEQVEFPDYIRQRLEMQTEPGIIMPMYLLKPTKAHAYGADAASKKTRWPVVIAPHGHCGGGKIAVAGVEDDPEVAKAIEQYNYAYGPMFARAGFIVFAPDARSAGERHEHPATPRVGSDCLWLNQMAISLGQSVTGMWTWDIHRLIDYIQTRRDCDPDRIGCAGLSGGGLQTLWAAALDERIKCAIISGYMYGYKESLIDVHCCACNYVPHLYEYVDMGDVAALIAPRACMIETGDQDNLNGASGLKNVKSQVAIMKRAYRLLGVEDRLKHCIFSGPHRWYGEGAGEWMKRRMKEEG